MTHSELPFVQGELKHLFKEMNRVTESFGNSPDIRNIKLNSTDCKTQLKEKNDTIKSTSPMLCVYADDRAILSRPKNLNTLTENINLAHLEIGFSVWKIKLNTSKTEAVFFSQRTPPPEIMLQNQRIPWSQHTKYIGVIIDKTLTF
ncbi:RNA-directed DNA polymerase from mobile element jockey [Trichonephila clavipes]|nr:RNA-directed DNA polymerase from mobile element jockey [Trichonephila clavipes]